MGLGKHLKVDEAVNSSTNVLVFHIKSTLVNVWDVLH